MKIAKSLKISKGFGRKIFDDFWGLPSLLWLYFSTKSSTISMICFRNVCFPEEKSTTNLGVSPLFVGKVTISLDVKQRHTFYILMPRSDDAGWTWRRHAAPVDVLTTSGSASLLKVKHRGIEFPYDLSVARPHTELPPKGQSS